MKLKSLRNGKTAVVIEQGNKDTAWYLRFEDDSAAFVTDATIKRWWREDENMIENTTSEPIPEPVAEPIPEPTPEPVAEPVKSENPKKAPKEKKVVEKPAKPRGKQRISISEMIIKNKLEEIATARGCEIVDFNVHGCRSIKHLGHHCVPFTYSSFGVIVWCHSAAIEGITEYRKVNHSFNARVKITEMNADTEKLMAQIVDAAMRHLEAKWAKKSKK